MTNKISPKKILVAVRPKDLPLVSAALGSEFNIVVCHTVKDAQAHLDQDIGLIACGVRFGNDRMFDLLRAVKAHPVARQVPFYLILGEGTMYSQAILQGIKRAAETLGCNGLLDLPRLEGDLGKAVAYENLRKIIRRHLEA